MAPAWAVPGLFNLPVISSFINLLERFIQKLAAFSSRDICSFFMQQFLFQKQNKTCKTSRLAVAFDVISQVQEDTNPKP